MLENMGFRVVDERTYRDRGRRCRRADVWLHDMVLERADGGADRSRRAEGARSKPLPDGDARHRRERRLQRAGADGRAGLARRRADPHDLALPAPDPRAVFAGLHVGDAAQARRHRGARSSRCSMRASIRALERRTSARKRARRRSSAEIEDALGRRSKASTRTASCATSSMRCRRRSAPTSTSSTRTASRSQTIAIKFASRKLDGLPLPRPLYEIFVYSPRVEGVHLRFGKVARGGIRWSDRPQDFRTEVLGLVKAQQVKNAVIVPVGAKGGFVPKQLPVGGTARGDRRPRASPPTRCSCQRCSTSPTISGPKA